MLLVDGGVDGDTQAPVVPHVKVEGSSATSDLPFAGSDLVPPDPVAAEDAKILGSEHGLDGLRSALDRPARFRQIGLFGSKLLALALVFTSAVTLFPSGRPDFEDVRNGGGAERLINGLIGEQVAESETLAAANDNELDRNEDAPTRGSEAFDLDLMPYALSVVEAGQLSIAAESGEWIEPTAEPESEWVDSGNGVRLPDLLLRIRFCESTNDYGVANRGSSARGAYQFLSMSWEWYGHAARYGVAQAHLATPAQQDEAALLTYQQDGARPWAESRACWGSDNIDSRYLTATPPVTSPPPAPTTTVAPDSSSNTSSTNPGETTVTSAEATTTSTTAPSTTTSSSTTPSSTTTSSTAQG